MLHRNKQLVFRDCAMSAQMLRSHAKRCTKYTSATVGKLDSRSNVEQSECWFQLLHITTERCLVASVPWRHSTQVGEWSHAGRHGDGRGEDAPASLVHSRQPHALACIPRLEDNTYEYVNMAGDTAYQSYSLNPRFVFKHNSKHQQCCAQLPHHLKNKIKLSWLPAVSGFLSLPS